MNIISLRPFFIYFNLRTFKHKTDTLEKDMVYNENAMIEINIKNFKSGLYIYRRLEDGTIVYVGKDSDLRSNRRHYDHNRADFKEGKRGQLINKVLQDHPEQYAYEQLMFCDASWMDSLEKTFIDYYRPEFNIVDNDRYKKKPKP